jgi:hypothetical protein
VQNEKNFLVLFGQNNLVQKIIGFCLRGAWFGCWLRWEKHEGEIKSFSSLFNTIIMGKWWHDINIGESPIIK